MTVRPLVAIPCRNNAAAVARVARGCLEHVPDVVVVDDGSADGTADAARTVPGVTVLVHPVNRGKGAALETALAWAADRGFTHVIAIDGDGQHLPEDLPRFLDATRAEPDAIQVGVRDMSGAPGASQFGRRFSNFWVRVDTGRAVGDTQCGFRVYPVGLVRALQLRPGRYEWEVAVLVRAMWAGVTVRDVPCQVRYPPVGERVSSFRPFWDNVRISLLNTRLFAERVLWPPRWVPRARTPDGAWRDRNLGRVWGWTFYLYMIRILGRWPTYTAMAVMALFYLVAAPSHRQGAQAYLRRAWPGINPAVLLWRTWRIFFAFACSIVDRFLLLGSGPQAFDVVHEDTDEARAALLAGGAVLLTAHVGNADLAAAALQDELRAGMPGGSSQGARPDPRPVHVLQYAAPDDPYLVLLRRYMDPARAPRILAMAPGTELASLDAVRVLREGGIVAIKGDRGMDGHEAEVPFLGGRIRLPVGPYLLAALAGVPVVPFACFREGARTCRVVVGRSFRPVLSGRASRHRELTRYAEAFASDLELWVRRWPLQWFNFHDPWVGPTAGSES